MSDLIVRPIVYTTVPQDWARLVAALGGRPLIQEGAWQVFALPDGRVAIHEVPDGDPLAGHQQLGFETRDLDRTAAELGGRVGDGAERLLRLTGPDGVEVYVGAESAGAANERPSAGTAVLPLWMTSQVGPVTAFLEGAGLTPRISSESGEWVDLTAPGGGLVAVHGGTSPEVQLSFEHPDLTALAARLSDAGLASTIVDESYGYSLRIPRPDGAAGEEVWVNQTQEDLYGYRRG